MQKLPAVCLVLMVLCLMEYIKSLPKEQTLPPAKQALPRFPKPLQVINTGHLPESTGDEGDEVGFMST